MAEITVCILKTIAEVLVTSIEAAMLIRVFLSWLDPEKSGTLYMIAYYISEPIVVPVRWLFDKFDLPDDGPIDLPFMASTVLLVIMEMIVFGL